MFGIFSYLLGLIPLGIIGLVFYIIVKRGNEQSTGTSKHAYYYLVSFVSLAILYWAIADLGRLLFGQQSCALSGGMGYSCISHEMLLRRVAGRLAAIIFAFPIWAFHWMKANPPNTAELDWISRKTYSLFVVAATVIGMLIAWPLLIYQLLTWALGVTESNIGEMVPTLLSYAIPATGIWIWHFKMWRKVIQSTSSVEVKKDSTPSKPGSLTPKPPVKQV